MKRNDGSLTDARLRAELSRCEYCEEKPCQKACPADCSPADFIMAAGVGEKSDYRRAAALIMGANPLGGVCGAVCPDYFCMCACTRLDQPINIPAVQATIIKNANEAGMPKFRRAGPNGKTVGIIGAGPAGLAAASVLAQGGYRVTIYEQQRRAGGAMNLIPDFRLNKQVVRADIAFLKSLGDIQFKHGKTIAWPEELLARHDALIVCAGLTDPINFDVPGGQLAISWQAFLENQNQLKLKGEKVAVLGGGAVAVDCATTAKRLGAASVELIYRRRTQDMPLTQYERKMLLEHGVEISSCCRLLAVVHQGKRVTGLRLAHVRLHAGR